MPSYTTEVGVKFEGVLNDLSSERELTKGEIIRRAVALYAFLREEMKEQSPARKLSITTLDGRILKDIMLP
jgi:hypothetical protein